MAQHWNIHKEPTVTNHARQKIQRFSTKDSLLFKATTNDMKNDTRPSITTTTPNNIWTELERHWTSWQGELADVIWDARTDTGLVCGLELVELVRGLAAYVWRCHRPDFCVLVVGGNHVVAETVAVVACLALSIPIVPIHIDSRTVNHPVSILRLQRLVQQLQQASFTNNHHHRHHNDDKNHQDEPSPPHSNNNNNQTGSPAQPPENEYEEDHAETVSSFGIAMVLGCSQEEDDDNGQDQNVQVQALHRAGLHSVVYLTSMGQILQQLRVPSTLPLPREEEDEDDEDLEEAQDNNNHTTAPGSRLVWATAVAARAPVRHDHLYVLTTSGSTSSSSQDSIPVFLKAVVGSQSIHLSSPRVVSSTTFATTTTTPASP